MKETFWHVWDIDGPLERSAGRLYLSAEPYDKVRSYTYYSYPVGDDRSPTGWREQYPLGWYREYTDPFGPKGEYVYAFVFRGSGRWFHSTQEAREWVETNIRR